MAAGAAGSHVGHHDRAGHDWLEGRLVLVLQHSRHSRHSGSSN
jgi:hypothetical protein